MHSGVDLPLSGNNPRKNSIHIHFDTLFKQKALLLGGLLKNLNFLVIDQQEQENIRFPFLRLNRLHFL